MKIKIKNGVELSTNETSYQEIYDVFAIELTNPLGTLYIEYLEGNHGLRPVLVSEIDVIDKSLEDCRIEPRLELPSLIIHNLIESVDELVSLVEFGSGVEHNNFQTRLMAFRKDLGATDF